MTTERLTVDSACGDGVPVATCARCDAPLCGADRLVGHRCCAECEADWSQRVRRNVPMRALDLVISVAYIAIGVDVLVLLACYVLQHVRSTWLQDRELIGNVALVLIVGVLTLVVVSLLRWLVGAVLRRQWHRDAPRRLPPMRVIG